MHAKESEREKYGVNVRVHGFETAICDACLVFKREKKKRVVRRNDM